MTAVRDQYNYRRLPKAVSVPRAVQPDQRSFTGTLTPVEDIGTLLRKPLTPVQKETILLRTARAARAPRYIELTERELTERAYGVEADPLAIRRNNLGMKYLEHDLTRAFRNFLDAVEIDDGFALAHNNLGMVLLEIGELQTAIGHLSRAIALDEGLDVAYGNRGLALLELSRFDEAFHDFQAALALDPDDGMHHNNAGILFLDLEEPEAALRYFNEAIRLAPAEPMPYLNRGLALREMGEFQSARRDFRRATEIEEEQFEALSARP